MLRSQWPSRRAAYALGDPAAGQSVYPARPGGAALLARDAVARHGWKPDGLRGRWRAPV